MTVGRRPAARLLPAGLLALAVLASACDDDVEAPAERFPVRGRVLDVQSGTQLRFYDQELNELDLFRVPVRPDGTYGPVALPEGLFLGAGTAAGGFTTGAFQEFQVPTGETTEVDLDLDPITVPLAVGNRWEYREVLFSPSQDTLAVTVEITDEQPGENVQAVYTVLERRTGGAGEPDSLTYFLARDPAGIRRSLDAVIDASDELLLRLPATLGTSWTTVDSAGSPVEKRIKAISCNEEGCVETDDFTIAQEPAGTFMSISVIQEGADGPLVVTTFSDVGIVDAFGFDPATQTVTFQRRLTGFTPAAAPAS